MFRVHTILVGYDMPVIFQRFPVKPAMNAEPLLRLILQADTELSAKHSFQAVAGSTKIRRRQSCAESSALSRPRRPAGKRDHGPSAARMRPGPSP
jgi:hypothetical protein